MFRIKPVDETKSFGYGNIILPHAELIRITTAKGTGFAILGGGVIYDTKDAWRYAKKLDALISYNKKRIKNCGKIKTP